MEENKDLKPEKKKTKKSETDSKTTSKKNSTKSTAKKSNSTTNKGNAKKTATSTTKKANTTKKETPNIEKEKTKTTNSKKVASKTSKSTKKEEKASTVEEKDVTKKLDIEKEIDPMEDFIKEEIEENKEKNVEEEINEKIEKNIPMPEEKEEIKKENIEETVKTIEEPKNKKKHSGTKAILVLLAIIVVLFLIHFSRNYIILDAIIPRKENLEDIRNYSYVMKDNEQILEYYHKDNIITIVKTVNNEKNVIWSDKTTKEVINVNLNELTASIDTNILPEEFYNLNPNGLSYDWKGNSRLYDFMYWITTDTVNGREAYKMSLIIGNETAWYDKDTGALLKYKIGDKVTEYSDWKINQVLYSDVTRPNLMGYTVTDNENNTITKSTDADINTNENTLYNENVNINIPTNNTTLENIEEYENSEVNE